MTIINVDFTGNSTRYFEPKPPQGRTTYCGHRTVEVDSYSRVVACIECGQLLDAFDYLHSVAQKEIRLFEQLNRLRKEESDLTQKVEALRNEERNLKARLKTAHKKQAEPNPKQPVLEKKDKQRCLAEIKQALGENGNPL